MKIKTLVCIGLPSLFLGLIIGVGLTVFELDTKFYNIEQNDINKIVHEEVIKECAGESGYSIIQREGSDGNKNRFFIERLSCVKNKTLQLSKKMYALSVGYERLECSARNNFENDEKICSGKFEEKMKSAKDIFNEEF